VKPFQHLFGMERFAILVFELESIEFIAVIAIRRNEFPIAGRNGRRVDEMEQRHFNMEYPAVTTNGDDVVVFVVAVAMVVHDLCQDAVWGGYHGIRRVEKPTRDGGCYVYAV